MAYDNTKLKAAIKKWIAKHCTETFGETYSGDLLESFNQFCDKTGAMKRSPGRVVFGRMLAERGYEKRKLCGLTYWSGIIIKQKEAPVVVPRANKKSPNTKTVQHSLQKKAERDKIRDEKEAELKQRAADVKKRMQAETKEKIQSAGIDPG